MKLFYIANIRMPTEKAHGIQIMKMCEAFSSAGLGVRLIVPTLKTITTDDPFLYYGVKKNFNIEKLFSVGLVRFGRVGFFIQSFIFSISSLFYLLKNSKKDDLIYGRDEFILWLISFFRDVVWETHNASNNHFARTILKRSVAVISITEGLKKYYLENGMASGDKIFVFPDAVELAEFAISVSKGESRERVSLPKDKKIVLYTGHLYEWKGAQTLADSAKFFKDDVLFVFVGGTKTDIKNFTDKNGAIKNIRILGQKPHSDIPFYLSSADILVIPNSGKEDISRLYTSPMKLFEYMAAGRPIIASDLPSMREILNDKNAVFFRSDDVKSLADALSKILKDDILSEKISRKASEDVKKYTWDKRAGAIINFINDKR